MTRVVSFAPSATLPAAAAGKNSNIHSGSKPLSAPTARSILSTRRKPFSAASRSQTALSPARASHLSRQLKQGSILAMMSPASATVFPRSIYGTVGVFL